MNLYSWDKNKNEENIQKHGVDFREARTVFDDPNAVYEIDDEHSLGEERFVVIGMSKQAYILFVCHCYRESDNVIRLISARKAESDEIDLYYGGIYETLY